LLGDKEVTMSTYTQIIYQIVFTTKNRVPCLTKDNRESLYSYIWGIIKNKNCHLYRIGGVEDHIHIITHLHPSVALADLVKDIKTSSSAMIKAEKMFKHFTGWQIGYGAFTYSVEAKSNLINYVKNQEAHHKANDYKSELETLLEEHKIEYDKKYLL